MKITVQDDSEGGALGAMQVRIKDLSAELERITVKVFGLHLPTRAARPIEDIRTRTGSRKQFQYSLFSRMLHATHLVQPVVPPQATPNNPATKTIEIKLSLPTVSEWPSPKQLAQKLLTWPLYRALAGALVIALIILLIASPFGGKTAGAGDKTKKSSNSVGPPPLERGTPPYATLLPAGKTAASLGGWAKVSPPGRSPVYAFVDKVGNARITVSEQPLPDGFKTDTENQVAELAEGFNATAKVTAKEGTIIHIGTSGDGPQSAIFTKNKLLILVKSTGPLTNNQWVAYVSSLQ